MVTNIFVLILLHSLYCLYCSLCCFSSFLYHLPSLSSVSEFFSLFISSLLVYFSMLSWSQLNFLSLNNQNWCQMHAAFQEWASTKSKSVVYLFLYHVPSLPLLAPPMTGAWEELLLIAWNVIQFQQQSIRKYTCLYNHPFYSCLPASSMVVKHCTFFLAPILDDKKFYCLMYFHSDFMS